MLESARFCLELLKARQRPSLTWCEYQSSLAKFELNDCIRISHIIFDNIYWVTKKGSRTKKRMTKLKRKVHFHTLQYRNSIFPAKRKGDFEINLSLWISAKWFSELKNVLSFFYAAPISLNKNQEKVKLNCVLFFYTKDLFLWET